MIPRHLRAVVSLAGVVAALLVAVATATAATVHFTHESYQAFQGQLKAHQIKAVTFNKKAHTVHVSLKDGRHVLASYPSHDEPALAAQVQAAGATAKVEKTKVKAKPVHHKLRYIAAGVLVVLIVIVALVLALNRRRPPATGVEPGTEAHPAGGAPGGVGAAPAGPGGAATAPPAAPRAGAGGVDPATRGVDEPPDA